MILGHGRSNVGGPVGHGKSTVDVQLHLAPAPKPFALQFIVELIADKNLGWLRPMMIGPFESYEQADTWILRVGRRMAARYTIHQLIEPPNEPVASNAPPDATIHKIDEP